jgi:hypothetical protein
MQQTELTENGTSREWTFRLFSAIGKQKQQTSICLLQWKWKTDFSFPWSANYKW